MSPEISLATVFQDLRSLETSIKEFEYEEGYDEFIKPIDSKIENLRKEVSILQTKFPSAIQPSASPRDKKVLHSRQSQIAFQTVTSVASLQSQINLATTSINLSPTIQRISATLKNTWNNLQGYLKSLVQNISSTIMNFIAQHLQPNGWTIAEELGFSFLGLSSSTTLEISF